MFLTSSSSYACCFSHQTALNTFLVTLFLVCIVKRLFQPLLGGFLSKLICRNSTKDKNNHGNAASTSSLWVPHFSHRPAVLPLWGQRRRGSGVDAAPGDARAALLAKCTFLRRCLLRQSTAGNDNATHSSYNNNGSRKLPTGVLSASPRPRRLPARKSFPGKLPSR